MADISLRLNYASKMRSSLLHTLRLTMPAWALALPVFYIASIILGHKLRYLSGQPTLPGEITNCMAILGVPLLFLLVIRSLEKSYLLIDKNGIELPAELPGETPHKEAVHSTFKSRYLPWKKVRRLFVDLNGRKLLLYERGEASRAPISIDLKRLSLADLEQLLVSADVFAPDAEMDPSVSELKLEVKNLLRLESTDGTGATSNSYTELWEQELSRRFRAAAFMPLEIGLIMRNGTLTVLRHLALGGLSAVYLAQLKSKQLVTLKESVIPEDAKDEIKNKARQMFAREAEILIKLKHANIAPVLDYFVENERSYLMLEYVSGLDLRQYVKQNGVVRESLVLEWAIQIAEILEYLHMQNPPVLHRDLTPDNLVAREGGQIVLIDFGAANEFIGQATGTFVGKQAYIAPEQFRGKATTASDIYAFGGTLHYLLTGIDPEALSQSSPAQTFSDNPGNSHANSCSPALDALIRDCTAMEESKRPENAAALATRLKAIATS